MRALARRVLRRDGSALIVPVPRAEPIVGSWRAIHDGSASDGMPAHVTVLFPFLPLSAIEGSVEVALQSVLANCAPFRFSLARIGRFPGVLYLAPEPSEPLLNMTAAIWARWPDWPPYRGAYETTIPHLTVATGTEPPGLAAQLERFLPIECEASEVYLMTKADAGRWSVRSRFPLGTRPTRDPVPDSRGHR